MAWVCLILASVFEVAWAVGLKYSDGLTRFWPSVMTLGAMILSLGLLAYAVRTIPVGTGYALWTGIGAVGTALLGMMLFEEPATAGRWFFLLLIVTGVVGLKFAS